MHDEILSDKQKTILPLIDRFSSQFGLVGGTAIALQLGHRESVDFDLFTQKKFYSSQIRETLREKNEIQKIWVDRPNELTLIVDEIKVTFYKYPFNIIYSESFGNIKMPNLLTLASMKAYAMGQRAKWKDYVDLYFIFKQINFNKVISKTKEIFNTEFNEKLFREELSYFEDVDYTEKITYLPGFETADEAIKESLIKTGLQK